MRNQVLTVKEVATMLRASTTTIYTMVREGELPHFRVRGNIMFHRETIEAWMTGGAEKVAE